MDSRLYQAATKGNVSILRDLIQEDREIVTSTTPQKNTALHIAAKFGHKNFAEVILQEFVSLLLMKNNDEDTPLHIAARAGHLDIVTLFIEKASVVWPSDIWPTDVETGEPSGPLRMTNKLGNIPLHEALRHGYSDIAMKLLSKEPLSGHVMNRKMETPLHIAAREGLTPVVAKILELPWVEPKEEVDTPLEAIGSPLHQAVLRNHIAIVRMLLDARRDLIKVIDKFGNNALHYAAKMNSRKLVEILLRKEPSLAYGRNSVDGLSPLHVAAAYNSNFAITEILKECPDAAEQVDEKGRNAIHIAVYSGSVNALKSLLRRITPGEIINQVDKDGNTPLHLAAKNMRIHSTLILLEDRRVDPCILNHEEKTPRKIYESLEELDMYEVGTLQANLSSCQ